RRGPPRRLRGHPGDAQSPLRGERQRSGDLHRRGPGAGGGGRRGLLPPGPKGGADGAEFGVAGGMSLGRGEARPDSTSVAGAYLAKPNLRVRFPGEESIRGRDLVTVDLEVSCFDVNEGIFSLIVRGESWQHLALVNFVAAPGELLFAIPGSRGCRSHET